MIQVENIFQFGREKTFNQGTKLFSKGDEVREDAIFFIKKGMLKLQIPKKDGSKITLYIREGDMIGVPEVYTGSSRVTEAVCESNIECYVWSESEFLKAVSIVWELCLYAIKSLSASLKILNSEFVDKISISI